MSGRRAAILLAVLLAAVVACGKTNASKPLSEKGEKLYTLKGKIAGRDAGDNTLKIDHEAVPGFMEAMTMDYAVRGARVADLPPDQTKITARLHVTEEKYWVTDVRKVP